MQGVGFLDHSERAQSANKAMLCIDQAHGMWKALVALGSGWAGIVQHFRGYCLVGRLP